MSVEEEIEGPHGCGVYGHKYYGMSRRDVIEGIRVEKYHIESLNVCIHSLNEDGLLSDEVCLSALNKLMELHKLLDDELMGVLGRGDEINKKHFGK